MTLNFAEYLFMIPIFVPEVISHGYINFGLFSSVIFWILSLLDILP